VHCEVEAGPKRVEETGPASVPGVTVEGSARTPDQPCVFRDTAKITKQPRQGLGKIEGSTHRDLQVHRSKGGRHTGYWGWALNCAQDG